MIRTTLAVAFLGLYVVLVGLPVIGYSLITRTSDFLFRAGKWGIGVSMRLAGVRVRAEGLENIPPGVCIFAANHVSNLDPPAALIGIPRRISFLAKAEVFNVPIVGTALRLGKIVAVDRSDRDAAIASIDQALHYLNEGISFVVFPEGTRSKDGQMKPFKKGTFVMAIEARVPVVPVSILGSRERMPRGTLAAVRGEILIRFAPAVDSAAYTMEQREILLAHVEATVKKGLSEPR
ncbi:MAG: lysophospholipid acyltransferase family protein [Candidatus Acidiferrales bacterium]